MDPSRQQEAADKLLEAHKSRTPIDALTKLFPDIEFEDSYRIQELTYEKWLSEGRVVKGHKVGLTSVVMQKQLGVSQPDYGHLLDDCFFLENNRINVNDYISPKVEPEIAFVLKKDLKGPGVNLAEAIAAVDFVLPSLLFVYGVQCSGIDDATFRRFIIRAVFFMVQVSAFWTNLHNSLN